MLNVHLVIIIHSRHANELIAHSQLFEIITIICMTIYHPVDPSHGPLCVHGPHVENQYCIDMISCANIHDHNTRALAELTPAVSRHPEMFVHKLHTVHCVLCNITQMQFPNVEEP